MIRATLSIVLSVGLLAAGCGTEQRAEEIDPVETTHNDAAATPAAPAEPTKPIPAVTTAPRLPGPAGGIASRVTRTEPVADPLRSATPLVLDPTRFVSSIETLDPVVTARVVGQSWTDGCPTPLGELRYVEVSHRQPDGPAAIGELIVHESVAEDIVASFASLFDADFPIASMRLVDDFDADDLRSMQANNTSAFNCRFVAGTTNWSFHAFGRAIDINPLINPYVTPNGVEPPEGAIYRDRSLSAPGMIISGDAVTTAFATIGWEWGGNWRSGQDYQHFARTSG